MLTVGETQLYTPGDMLMIEALRNSTYFLVRNGGADSPAKCGRCGAIHAYLTRMCIEQPYRGLLGALYAYVRITHDAAHMRRISGLRAMPYLHDGHPYTAHERAPVEGEEIVAYELGAAEPIDEKRAMRYAEALRIRRVQPPYILEG